MSDQIKEPTALNVNGYPIAALDASYSGLCSYAVSSVSIVARRHFLLFRKAEPAGYSLQNTSYLHSCKVFVDMLT
jgi:hypothetical protein